MSLNLSPLQTSAEEGTIPTLHVIQPGRHCLTTTDYYFSSIELDPIVIPPHPKNNNSSSTKQHYPQDPIPEDPSPLRPGEIQVYPSDISTNKIPVLDLTNTAVTSELNLCATFHSLNVCLSDTQKDTYGREKSTYKESTP